METRAMVKANAWDAFATRLGVKRVTFQGRFSDKTFNIPIPEGLKLLTFV